MPRFTRHGTSLAYDDSAEPDLQPLVLLHGLSSARTTWATIAERLTGRYRLLALDHRGHGESEHAAGTYTLDHYGPDTIAFCEEVVGAPVVLIGHSLGGVIAAYVGQERADLLRGVVLEDPPLYRGEAGDGAATGMAAFFPVLQQLFRDLQARGAPLDEYEAMLRATPALNGSGGTMTDVLGAEGTRAQAEAWAGLDPEVFTSAIAGTLLAGVPRDTPLGCPAHVLRADPTLGAAFTDDDARRFQAANPQASVVAVEGASHAVHDEQPDRVLAEVEAFLDRLPTA
jgi:pimeloyl-ACP methyl ester carboxylesterase